MQALAYDVCKQRLGKVKTTFNASLVVRKQRRRWEPVFIELVLGVSDLDLDAIGGDDIDAVELPAVGAI